jgi:NosR/NirI family transcriptional regulator, nitrous oxide reductase regulator
MFSLLLMIGSVAAGHPKQLDCESLPCREVLPGAVRFESSDQKPYLSGRDEGGTTLGWVGLSEDLVPIRGYSGKPIQTLVGIDLEGVITGSQILWHAEPILLLGIPESELTLIAESHSGLRADQRATLGQTSQRAQHIDGISGATVTVLSLSRTITDSALEMAEEVGVLKDSTRVSGHFVDGLPIDNWRELSDNLGHLVVEDEDVGLPATEVPFADIWFGIADSQQVGIPLLGERTWKWATSDLADGEHLLVVFNRGTGSFKGSGFVRGGMFDRFQLEQGLRTITFRDLDHSRIPSPSVDGSPRFSEGGLFVIRNDDFEPGEAFEFVLLASAYATERGAFERDFYSFRSQHRLPRSIYAVEEHEEAVSIWREAWRIGGWKAIVVSVFYILVVVLFSFRAWMSASYARLTLLNTTILASSFIILGAFLHVQPSVTQLLTLVGGIKSGWNASLFLSEPSVFVSWIGIFVLIVIWGRGAFCGWLCPYGALSELAHRAAGRFGLPTFEVPDRVHRHLRKLRYLVLFVLFAAFLHRAELGEQLAEIEPFKSTFFVPFWNRQIGAIAWWWALFLWSLITYRPFCRYLCPMGAALSLPSTFRLIGPRRRQFCSKCKICTRGCEAKAIDAGGRIDPRECLNCWKCESNWRNADVCPPLVAAKRRKNRKKESNGAL